MDADELYKQAYEKYEAALKIRLDDYEALYYWGINLATQAAIKEDAEAEELYRQAEEILLRVETLKEGVASYDLALIYALTKNADESHKWLLNSKKFEYLPGKETIEKDFDLDAIRDADWFRNFLKDLS